MDIGNGYHLIDKYFMITIGMGILPIALISFPMWLGNSFENNSMERMIYFGVSFRKMMLGDIFAHLILVFISMAFNILFAFIFFGLKFPHLLNFIMFILHYLIAVILAMIIGGIFALVFRNTQILMPFGLVVMFVLYMFCGVFITYDEMPAFFKNVASFIPMKYAMNDLYDIWTNQALWNVQFLNLSVIYLIVSIVLLAVLIKKNSGLSTKIGRIRE